MPPESQVLAPLTPLFWLYFLNYQTKEVDLTKYKVLQL